ncbi:MAG: hypothetical protein OXC80_02180 [Gammaproteobacteria bacterium]|nr:hypothetical protein [Gammaproteobacteria bacterium]
MTYVCIALGLLCGLFAWKLYPIDILTSNLLLLTGILAIMPTRVRSFPKMLHRIFAALGCILSFLMFGQYFSSTPYLHATWYLTPFVAPYMGLFVGGITAMTVISENSCCLKVDHAKGELPQLLKMVSNTKQRLQQLTSS